MRIAAYSLVTAFLAFNGWAADLSAYEATCAEIGFKKKTPAFGECVLELHSRANRASQVATKPAIPASASGAQAIPTNLNEDEQRCVEYGFNYGTSDFAGCRQRFELARLELEQRKAEHQTRLQKYEIEKRQYEQRVAEYERQKREEQALKLQQFGLALMTGRSSSFAENLANASRITIGLPPLPPSEPPPITSFTINGPRGSIYCNGLGNVINCR